VTARIAVALTFAAGLLAQQPPDFAKLGPAVGQPFPPFEARDQSGNVRSLAGLMGPNGLVLVFFRSADW